MNALSGLGSGGSPLIPENAPFNAAQRSWLNGFLAGLYGGSAGGDAGMSMEGSVAAAEEDFPWHDPAMEMDERLQLAEGRPFERKLMAAMAQLDCGQCGYLCQSYAEALASGTWLAQQRAGLALSWRLLTRRRRQRPAVIAG